MYSSFCFFADNTTQGRQTSMRLRVGWSCCSWSVPCSVLFLLLGLLLSVDYKPNPNPYWKFHTLTMTKLACYPPVRLHSLFLFLIVAWCIMRFICILFLWWCNKDGKRSKSDRALSFRGTKCDSLGQMSVKLHASVCDGASVYSASSLLFVLRAYLFSWLLRSNNFKQFELPRIRVTENSMH